MSKINILSSKIYNRISAGEVIEKPASVVKELVENSIDAGAKNITVNITDGGISSIIVSDNGSGIEKSEMKKVFLPHATSKISSVSDLDNICSLGFRGEAIPSIASVSKIKIISKTKEQELGTEIYCEGGVMGELSDSASPTGTEITVNNLFFNTPAREKFLKSTRSEESEVSTVMARFILGNPFIAFKYIADGKLIYQSYGDGEEASFISIYGTNTLKDCFYIDTEKNGIKIKGYIGKQYFSKGNRTYQTVFLNNRYIVNQTIMAAISNAYSAYLMTRQYPFCVINVSVPTHEVDVNVHPNKLDVRFSNNQIIYGAIYSVISKVLDGSFEALNIVAKDGVLPENKQNITTKSNDYARHNNSFNNVKDVSSAQEKFNKIVFHDVASIKEEKIENSKSVVDIFAENKAYLEKLEKEKAERLSNVQDTIKIEKELKFIGQALNTFLIFEDGEDLYMVDQHAAHERILFDKFNLSVENAKVDTQDLLIPFVLNVNSAEYEFLLSKKDILASIGIEISEFGKDSFKVCSIPVFMTDMNIQKFFNDILSSLDSLKGITIKDLLKEKIAQKACKSAIKSGDKLTDGEIKILMNLLKGNLALKCPHGRPIAVKITRMEIDKWFKRII